MNKQRTKTGRGIEWTDFPWNRVGGCPHDCRWEMPDGSIAGCYAKAVAEGVARAAYPEGFEHHYWHPHRLEEPLKLKTPGRIFLDSMSDLMAHWVTDDQIRAVLDICAKADWHQFQLLTKNPRRLTKFEYPKNVWVGASLPPTFFMGKRLSDQQQQRMMEITLQALEIVSWNNVITWMSFEPLSWDVAAIVADSPAVQWAVIGAATNGRKTYQPDPQHVERLLTIFDIYKTPVFFKGNLEWTPWREEFPAEKPRR